MINYDIEGEYWRLTMIETNSSHETMIWTEKYFFRLDHMEYMYRRSMISTQLTTSHNDSLFLFFIIFYL